MSDFFFNNTATTEIYTLALRAALPICTRAERRAGRAQLRHLQRALVRVHARALPVPAPLTRRRRAASTVLRTDRSRAPGRTDRKSTRLNSSHANISYAVF